MPSTMFHGDLVTSKRILYTPSAFAKSSLLYLQEIGELEANHPHVSKRKDLDSYLLMCVEKGTGTLSYQGQRYELVPGDCIFIDCSVGYAHATTQDLWSLRWIHFSGLTMANIYEKYVQRGGKVCLDKNAADVMIPIWQNLYGLAESDDYLRDMKINEGLTSLITRLMEMSWNPARTAISLTGKKDLHKIQAYLDQHFREKLTLDQIAKEFYMDKYYLAHIFKENMGLTIVEYLQYKRVSLAKQLLRFSDFSIEQIGIQCGIEDPNYFARTFRKIEGISPAKYRKLWIS